MDAVVNRWIRQLIAADIIKEDDKEIYIYGLVQGFLFLLNIVTTILIGLSFGLLWQSILFMFLYLPLRSYAGGIHARTQKRCYFLSMALTAAVLSMIRFFPWSNRASLCMALAAAAVIGSLAPVEDSNKPLDAIERSVFRHKVWLLLAADLLIYVLLFIAGKEQVLVCISTSLLTLSIILVLGRLRNHSAACGKMERNS